MRDRIVGVENEYAVALLDDSGASCGDLEALNRILTEALGKYVKRMFPQSACKDKQNRRYTMSDLWLPNGSRVYVDQKYHPEYATPECRSVLDAITHNKAGERVVSKIWKDGVKDKHIRIFKNNVARHAVIFPGDAEHEWVSYGCHENYLLSSDAKDRAITPLGNPLVLFLVTRQILDGGGWWEDPEKDVFHISQRAPFIFKEVAIETTNQSRAIINEKGENHVASTGLFGRLHLILGDANMLETALFLKLGTTRIMLAMFEDKLLPLLRVELPAAALKAISLSRDVSEKILPVYVREDNAHAPQWMSALEVQMFFCEQAKKYVMTTVFDSEESKAEAERVCVMWEDALTALASNDKQWMFGRLDYKTKEMIVENIARTKKARGESVSLTEERETLDLLYHEIGGKNTLYDIFLGKGLFKRIVEEQAIVDAEHLPPRNTRAWIRGQIIQRVIEERLPFPNTMDWSKVGLGLPQESEFSLGDPLSSKVPWLKEFFKKLREL